MIKKLGRLSFDSQLPHPLIERRRLKTNVKWKIDILVFIILLMVVEFQ
ncbi:MAG: hypothetical protein HRF47_08485 [Chloroflexota bacterium]